MLTVFDVRFRIILNLNVVSQKIVPVALFSS